MDYKRFLIFAAISMAVAVVFGALGAHALKSILGSEGVDTWRTAVLYQVFHSLSIFLIVIIARQNALEVKSVLWTMLIGMSLFSGSIYLLTMNKIWLSYSIGSFVGPITPIGGLLMIISWIIFALKLKKG